MNSTKWFELTYLYKHLLRIFIIITFYPHGIQPVALCVYRLTSVEKKHEFKGCFCRCINESR